MAALPLPGVIDVDEEKRTILFEACGSGSNPYYKTITA